MGRLLVKMLLFHSFEPFTVSVPLLCEPSTSSKNYDKPLWTQINREYNDIHTIIIKSNFIIGGKMAHDVFISYSHKDKQVADAICSGLERNSIRCWYAPRDIEPGKEWANAIIEAIPRGKVFVLVFSESSNISKQVIREVAKAVSSQLTLIPFKIDNIPPTGSMEYYLNAIHWLDAFDGQLSDHIEQFTKRVLAVLDMDTDNIQKIQPVKIKRKKASAVKILSYILAGALIVGGGAWAAGKLINKGEAGGKTPSSVAVPSNEGAFIEDPENSYTTGNLQCNLSNGGIAASYEGMIYYSSNDNHCLYKMEANGKNKVKLTEGGVKNISVYDGWVYYSDFNSPSSIHRTKIDGSATELLFEGHTEGLRIIDNKLYFKDGRKSLHLTSMNLDGTNPQMLNEIDKLYHFAIAEGKVYYSNQADGGCMWRVNLDGSEPVKLSEQSVDSIALSDGYIVYTLAPSSKASSVRAMNMTTFEDTELYSDYFYYLTVSDYGIIAHSGVNKQHIYKLPLNKNAAVEISPHKAESISIADGWVFYINKEDDKLYRVDANGQNLELVE